MSRSLAQSQAHTNRSSCCRFTCYDCPWPCSLCICPPSATLHTRHPPHPGTFTFLQYNICSQSPLALMVLHPQLQMPYIAFSSENVPMLWGPAQMSTLLGSLSFILLVRIHHVPFMFSQHPVCSFTLVFIYLFVLYYQLFTGYLHWTVSFSKAESMLFFFSFSAINTLYWKEFNKCLLTK